MSLSVDARFDVAQKLVDEHEPPHLLRGSRQVMGDVDELGALLQCSLVGVLHIVIQGFKFLNPNERDRCGCGESFRI